MPYFVLFCLFVSIHEKAIPQLRMQQSLKQNQLISYLNQEMQNLWNLQLVIWLNKTLCTISNTLPNSVQGSINFIISTISHSLHNLLKFFLFFPRLSFSRFDRTRTKLDEKKSCIVSETRATKRQKLETGFLKKVYILWHESFDI